MRHRTASHRAISSLVVTAILVASLAMVHTGSAQSPVDWSEPELLMAHEGRNWFPEIDADQAGNVRIVWEVSNQPDGDVLSEMNASQIMLSAKTAGEWQLPGDIFVKDVLNAGRPIIVSDDSYVHVIGRALLGEGASADAAYSLGGMYYMRAPLASDLASAQSWSRPVPISNSSAYWASLIALSDGVLVAVYNETINISARGTVHSRTVLTSRRSTDYGASWERPVRISSSLESAARSSLTTTGDGTTVIVSWDEGYDNMSGQRGRPAAFTSVSQDAGLAWAEPSPIGRHNSEDSREQHRSNSQFEQSVVSANDEVTMLVYRSRVSSRLFYRLSHDGGRSWSEEAGVPDTVARPYSGPHHFDKLGMAVDGDGRFLLAYVGPDPDDDERLAVMFTTLADGAWTSPQAIGAHAGFPEYPRVAVSLGNQVYVTYFVREELFDDDMPMTVWVVQGMTDAQAVAPVLIEEVAPSLTPGETGSATVSAPAVAVQVYPNPDRSAPQVSVDTSGMSSPAPRSTLTQPVVTSVVATLAVLSAIALTIVAARTVRFFRI